MNKLVRGYREIVDKKWHEGVRFLLHRVFEFDYKHLSEPTSVLTFEEINDKLN